MVLSLVFLVLAARVVGNRAAEPSRMGPEKHLFGFFRLLFVRAVRRSGRRSLAGVVKHEDEILRRQRDRARIMAVLLGAFVILVFFITMAKAGMNW